MYSYNFLTLLIFERTIDARIPISDPKTPRISTLGGWLIFFFNLIQRNPAIANFKGLIFCFITTDALLPIFSIKRNNQLGTKNP